MVTNTICRDLKQAENIRKVIGKMPNSFPEALKYLMKCQHVTIEQLSEYSDLSTSTIKRLRTDEQHVITMNTLVRICIGLRLHPIISSELVERSPLRLCVNIEHILYRELLRNIPNMTIEQCMEALESIEEIKLSGKSISL